MLKLFLYIALFVSLASLVRPIDNGQEFKNWYAKNSKSLSVDKKTENFTFSTRFIPRELKVLREVSKNEISTKQARQKLKSEELIEFSFYLKSNEGIRNLLQAVSSDKEDYNDRLFYLLEDIINDFELEYSSRFVKPLRCSFENDYGVTPFIKLHLVFEKKKGDKLKRLLYDDKFLNQGVFEFNLEYLEKLNIPKIK